MTALLDSHLPARLEKSTPRPKFWRVSGSTWSIVLLGGVLLVGAVAAQLVWLVPPVPSDQTNYLQAARDFPSEPSETFDHQFLRYGMVVPMRLAIEVFGYSQAAYYTLPVLSCALLVLSTYALGVMWFGRVVGVLATLLVIGNSSVFHYLTMPSPDTTGTACFMAAVALAAAVRRRGRWVASTPPRRVAALVLIGTLLAASYLCREFLVALWPVVGLLLFRRTRPREIGWLVAPVIIFVVAEAWINAVVVGDPLARFHATAEHGSGPMPAAHAATYQNKTVWFYLTRFPVVLYENREGVWLLGLLAVTLAGGVLAVAALRGPLRSSLVQDPRVRRLGLLLLWILLLWLPLTLLGGLLNPAQPKLRLVVDRYWFPVFPAVFLGAVVIARLAGGAAARRIPALRSLCRRLSSARRICRPILATASTAHVRWKISASG